MGKFGEAHKSGDHTDRESLMGRVNNIWRQISADGRINGQDLELVDELTSIKKETNNALTDIRGIFLETLTR